MNVIIIAACIPTLRPLFLVLFSRPGSEHYCERRHHSSYHRTGESNDTVPTVVGSTAPSKVYDRRTTVSSGASTKSIHNKRSIMVNDDILVESRELESRGGSSEEGDWGHAKGSGVPLHDIEKPSRESLAASSTVRRERGESGVPF